MEEENGMSGQQKSETPAEPPLPAPEDAAATLAGNKRRFTDHKILLGAGIGILAALLLVGMFFVGYLVGSEDDKGETMGPGQRVQQLPARPDTRSAPSPGDEWAGPDRSDILREYHDELVSVVADKLGISVDDLEDEMAGETIAEIAEEKGVSTNDLATVVAVKIGEIADKLAAEGEITTQQAEKIKSNAEEMASRLIEGGFRMQPIPPG